MQVPDEQHVDPVQLAPPPHCPYKPAQFVPTVVVVVAVEADDDVLDLEETEVDSVKLVTLLLLLLLDVVPPPAVPVNLTVTTEYEGSETVTTPPEREAEVELTEFELSVSHALAEAGTKPENDTAADSADAPAFVNTTTTLPSVFSNAPTCTPVIAPAVPSLTAPGRTNRLHMAKAHRRPEAVAVAPSSTATR